MDRKFPSPTKLAQVACFILIGGLAWITPLAADTFGGRAFSAFVSAPTFGASTMYLSDTGELAPRGGWEGAGLLGASVPGVLDASVLNAATSGAAGQSGSSSSLADIVLLPGHPAQVTASFVRSQATSGSGGARAITEVTDLTFGGRAVTVSGLPNQRIDIPLVASLIINEQAVTADGTAQTVTVNALRLVLATGDEVILAGARSHVNSVGDVTFAGLAQGSGPMAGPLVAPAHAQPECFDFVTGGGWFEPRFEGGPPERVNFGFNAGYRTEGGDLKGHFNLVDHNDKTHLKGVDVDTYARYGDVENKCRMFGGDAEMNGIPGFRYHVGVCDYGEPGRDDRIRVVVFGPDGAVVYFADDSDSGKTCDAGEPNCGDLDGGNIQLHKPCPQVPASVEDKKQSQIRKV
jgi:hypothetical protein